MRNIGNQLQTLRLQAGLTQMQVAQAIGLSGNSLISRIESGRSVPSERVLRQLAEFFDQEVEALATLATAETGTHAVLQAELQAMAKDADRARQRLTETVDHLVGEIDEHRDTLSNFLLASKLNLVWALPRKLRRERIAQTVWVLTPDLESETCVPGVRATVATNLARGTIYRYLIPNRGRTLERAQALLHDLGAKRFEIRIGDDALFEFAIETVIYDAGTDQRLGLMVAPTRRTEFDIVLGADTAERFEHAFEAHWSAGQPYFAE